MIKFFFLRNFMILSLKKNIELKFIIIKNLKNLIKKHSHFSYTYKYNQYFNIFILIMSSSNNQNTSNNGVEKKSLFLKKYEEKKNDEKKEVKMMMRLKIQNQLKDVEKIQEEDTTDYLTTSYLM